MLRLRHLKPYSFAFAKALTVAKALAVLFVLALGSCTAAPQPGDQPGQEQNGGSGNEGGQGGSGGQDHGQDQPGDVDDWKPGEGVNIYGTVISDGTPIPDVVVSDGYVVTTTDSLGRYSMKSDKTHGYAFISVPSGYEVPLDGVIPRFFERTTAGQEVIEKIDFDLFATDQSRYTLLVLGDMHLANRSFCKDLTQFRRFADEVQDIVWETPTPVYAITLGDMSWDYFWSANHYDLNNYLDEIEKDIKGLPIFHTMGNHDNDPSFAGDFNGEGTYKRIIGPTYYSFNLGACHYIVLDDVQYKNATGERDYYSNISQAQLEWVVKDLQHVSSNTPVFVSMHCPLYRKDGSKALYNMWDLVKLFYGYDEVHFLTGHTHIIYNVDATDRDVHVFEHNSGAVCGAWWMTDLNHPGTHISGDGALGGYRIFEMDGKDFTWFFKGTGQRDDAQFRSYDMDGNTVWINVWDWDPQWTISVTEYGKKLPVTRLKDVKDPLYLEVYEKYQTEHGYSISYPAYTTDHIFSVQASDEDSDLTITVTDRFGRIYNETMVRPKPLL